MTTKSAAPDLKMSPLPHQQRVSSRLAQTPGQLAAHGLGSGKTFTAIQAAHEHGLPLLAIVPASLRENMWKEIRDSGYTGPVDVMSYEKALKLADDPAFQARAKDSLVVYDEAHRMGQYGSMRSELAEKIPAAKTMLLTATPIRNRPSEIAPLVNAIQPGTLPKRPADFNRRYIQHREVPLGFWAKLRGAKRGVVPEPINIEEFRKKTKGLIDFHKALDREHYPTFSESVFEVPMSEEQQAAYDFTMGKYPALAYKIKHGIPPSKSELRNLRSFLIGPRQVSNFPGTFSEKATHADAPKLQMMADQIEERMKGDPNFRGVSYSAFLDAGVNPLSEILAKRGIPHATFTGSAPEKKRQQMVRDYNAGKVPVLLVSGAGSEGLDLKGTKLMQIAEPHWHEEQINQVRGRAIRFGSHGHLPEDERHVEVQRFHSQPRKGWFRRMTGMKAPKGVDQYVHGIAQRKQELNKQFIDALQQDEQEGLKAAALTHTRDWQGDTYDVNRLIELAEGRPVQQMPLVDLRYDRSRKTGFSKARYEGADLQYPLLVHPSGEVIDGRHRAARWEDAGGQPTVPVRIVTDEDLAQAKAAASPLGPCLYCSLAAIDADPSLQLMQGPPGREGDTSHFWTVDAAGKVQEHTPGAVGDDYAYEGRPVDHQSVREELKISSVLSNWVPFMFANPPTEGVYSAVLFDIDGTLVEDGAFTKPADQQTMLPGRLDVLKELRRHGYVVAAVTNRCDGTAFGKKDVSQPECRRRIMGVIHSCKGHLLDVIYEPDPEAYQERRKPAPDLLYEAIAVFDVDPEKVIYVGNSDDDKKAAENADIPYVDAEEFFADPGKHVKMEKVEHPYAGDEPDLKVVEEAMKTAQQSARPGDDPIHSGPHSVDFNTAFIERKERQNEGQERFKRRLRGAFNEALEQERESRKVV